MKQFRSLLMVLALVGALTVPALAADGAEASRAPETVDAPAVEVGTFATAGDLFQFWSARGEGYPDYVCGVWSTDGSGENLTIAVTDDEAGEQGKREILALVENEGTVTFAVQTYPYAHLCKVQMALESGLGEDNGMFSIGIDERNNCVVIGIDSANENAQAFMAETAAQYGDMVRFEGGDGLKIVATVGTEAVVPTTGAVMETGPEPKQYVLVVCLAVVLLGGGVFFVLRRVPAMQTADGQTATGHSRPTRSQVEQAVREEGITPDERNLDEILKKLDEN